MQFISESTSDGVMEQLFTIGDVPGVLWSSAEAAEPGRWCCSGMAAVSTRRRPACWLGPAASSRLGFVVAAIDAPGHGDRPRKQRDEQFSAGHAGADGKRSTALAIRRSAQRRHRGRGDSGVAGDPGCLARTGLCGRAGRVLGDVAGQRNRRAVGSRRAEDHRRCPWPDRDRECRRCGRPASRFRWSSCCNGTTRQCRAILRLALFDALGSPEKTLHANPGPHGGIPPVRTGQRGTVSPTPYSLAGTLADCALLTLHEYGVAGESKGGCQSIKPPDRQVLVSLERGG